MRRVSLLAVDLVLVGATTFGAGILRDNLEVIPGHMTALVPYCLIALAVAAPLLALVGLNRSVWRYSGLSDYVRIVIVSGLIVAGALFGSFLINRQEGVARATPLIHLIIMIASMVGVRVAIRVWHGRRRPAAPIESVLSGERREVVLIVGLNAMTELYIRAVSELGERAPRIAGLLGRAGHHTGRLLQRYRVLGTPEEIRAVLGRLEVHGVHVSRIVITSRLEQISEEARDALLMVGEESSIALDFLPERIFAEPAPSPPPGGAPRDFRSSGPDVPLAASRPGEMKARIDTETVNKFARRFYWRVKRVFDALLSLVLIVVFAPLFVLATLLVIADTGFPIMFWQQRPGLGGRPFRLYKFRTMAARYDSRGRSVPDEKRTSKIGLFLRRSRLDELPQLFNILFGDMSFVGPRPLLPIDQSSDFAARLLVRPGLTGWAQVMGGRVIGADDKAALDVWYICKASFLLDLIIMAGTVPMLLKGERTNGKAIGQAWLDLTRLGIWRTEPDVGRLVPGE